MDTPTTTSPSPRGGRHRGASGRLRRRLQTAAFLVLPLGLGASVLAAGVGVVGADVPAPAQPSVELAAQAVPSARLQTFTLNVLHDLNKDQARADMDRAMTLGEVGAFQEMSDGEDRASLIELCTAKDWGWYMPTDSSGAVPIVWNRQRFRLIEGRSTMTHGPVDGSPARWVNVVRLRELATGKVFGVVNTHTISNASFDAQLSDMSKIPLLRQHLQVLRAEILALFTQTEFVFAAGDLNVNYLADRNRRNAGLPTSALGDVVSFDMPLTGSRGAGSLLDYGMTVKDNGGLRLAGSQVVYGFNSDHDAIQFTYDPVDLLATGPVFNDRRGTPVQKRAVVDRQIRAVQGTEAGSTVRLAASRIDDQSLVDNLAAARNRGVAVQVVLGPGAPTGQEAALASALGGDTTQPSWLRRCSGGCIGEARSTQLDFLLVDRTQGATGVSMIASAPFTAQSQRTWTDMYLTTDDALHAAYAGLFARLAADSPATVNPRKIGAGSLQVQLYPTTKDPVAAALARVKCTGAKGLQVKNGRTAVRAQVTTWSGSRGKKLAQRMVTLKRQGCDVQVVTAKKPNAGVKKILDRGRVSRATAQISQDLLVVDGRWARKNRVSTAWVGGPGWSQNGLQSDGATLVVSDRAAVGRYLDTFATVRKAG